MSNCFNVANVSNKMFLDRLSCSQDVRFFKTSKMKQISSCLIGSYRHKLISVLTFYKYPNMRQKLPFKFLVSKLCQNRLWQIYVDSKFIDYVIYANFATLHTRISRGILYFLYLCVWVCVGQWECMYGCVCVCCVYMCTCVCVHVWMCVHVCVYLSM